MSEGGGIEKEGELFEQSAVHIFGEGGGRAGAAAAVWSR